MRAEDARRWLRDHRAAEDEGGGRLPADAPPRPDVAWRQALSLFALVGRMIGWPIEPDDLRQREDALAADTWRRLRAAYGRRP